MHAPLAILLAAGKGTRMGSTLAKVLHPVADEPMVFHPIRAAQAAGVADIVVVVGHQAAAVEAAIADRFPGVRFALQAEQRGTGHAVLSALPALATRAGGPVLILSGDVPCLRPETLRRLVDAATRSPASLALTTFEPPEPTGYGRILRDDAGRVVGIREERDASAEERAIREVNAGIYCVDLRLLREHLPTLGTDNAQGEIYLTDIVAALAPRGEIATVAVDAEEVAGINDPQQLAAVDRRLRRGGDPGAAAGPSH